MAILDTIKKIIPYRKSSSGYEQVMLSSQSIEMDDGNTLEDEMDNKETTQKRTNSGCFYKDGYDCHLHSADTPASDVVKTLSTNYRPRGGVVTVSGWCKNKSNGGFYPCVGRINSDGSWSYLSAMTDFGMTDVYYIYNKSEGTNKLSNFNVWLSGTWATNTNGA